MAKAEPRREGFEAVSPHNTDHYIMKRSASAVWQGDLKKGQGTLSTQSGVLNKTQYSFATRFENGIGTNPEELIAAAHAGCFTMALSAFLGNAGFTPEELSTRATLTLEQVEGNWTITAIHLDLSGVCLGLTERSLMKLPIRQRPVARFRACSRQTSP